MEAKTKETKQLHTKTNLKAGDYLIRESSKKGTTDFGFARSVTFKVSFWDDFYGLCSVCDGMILYIAKGKEAFCDKINADEYGFRQLTKDEYYAQLDGTMQGFDPKYPSALSERVRELETGNEKLNNELSFEKNAVKKALEEWGKCESLNKELIAALKESKIHATEWRDYQVLQVDSFEGAEKQMIIDIARSATKSIEQSESVLSKARKEQP